MISKPLVSIAMPVFNCGLFLQQAVESIIAQSFSDWELMILDDGSTDGSTAFLGNIQEPRVHLIADSSNQGIAARLNQAIDLSRGTYLARMDGDDICHPDRLKAQVSALRQNDSIDLLATRAVAIDSNNHIVGELPWSGAYSEICRRPWLGFHFPHPTWMGKIEWFRRYRYKVPAPYRCEDQEVLLRSHRTSRFHCLSETLLAYRVREKQQKDTIKDTYRSLWEVQQTYFRQHGPAHYRALSTVAFFARNFRLRYVTPGYVPHLTNDLECWGSTLQDLRSVHSK